MSEIINIRQDNALTNARFEYTALERNLFYAVLGQLKKTDDATTNYYVSISELSEKMGTNASYKDYREATLAILSRTYEMIEANGDILQVNMFSHCRYEKGGGRIEIGLSPQIRPYLFDIKDNFTSMQLEVALAFGSKYSKRLYEILNMKKNQDNGVFTLSVLELKTILALYNPKTKDEIYPQWTDFNTNVLKKAQKEMNSNNCDISFTYLPEKKSRKFVSITFSVESKAYQKTIEFKDEGNELFSRLVNKFDLRKDQAEKALKIHETDFIIKTLYNINLMKMNKQIHTSLGAYTAKALGV